MNNITTPNCHQSLFILYRSGGISGTGGGVK
jgi:hypothetical protein